MKDFFVKILIKNPKFGHFLIFSKFDCVEVNLKKSPSKGMAIRVFRKKSNFWSVFKMSFWALWNWLKKCEIFFPTRFPKISKFDYEKEEKSKKSWKILSPFDPLKRQKSDPFFPKRERFFDFRKSKSAQNPHKNGVAFCQKTRFFDKKTPHFWPPFFSFCQKVTKSQKSQKSPVKSLVFSSRLLILCQKVLKSRN